jgi:3-hydroxybutyryl-CoA dehydrogenase
MEVNTVGIVGLGTMGGGIAQLCVEAGINTVGHEANLELGERAKAHVSDRLRRKVEKGEMELAARETALELLELSTDIAGLARCDLVIEAVFEDLGVKQELLQRLEEVVGPEAILATNTSALSVTEIASAAGRPGRVVGMHFFNPVTVMPLVEIVRAERSDEHVVEAAFALAERVGKKPIRCADTPGFVVNRILLPLLNDCIRVIDEAGVSIHDLDTAMRYGAGWPMGPGALADLIGIDVLVDASEALHEGLRDPRMAPPPRLVRMAQAGKLGRKSGEGFYSYASAMASSDTKQGVTA